MHIHSGAQGVVGIINSGKDGSGGEDGSLALDIHRHQRASMMRSKLPMHLTPRCGARTRSGNSCRAPAMPNGRCRMHGGLSPGAPKGNKNALKHGLYTVLEPGTLNAAIALIASINPQTELEALLAVQIVATGFAGLKLMQRGQSHLEEAYISVYGGYGTRLLRLQLELIQALDKHRRGHKQT